jgi:glycosyltransferase involved in cell wall biosynthesis
MAFGKPVICVDRGGPRESVKHGIDGFLEPPEAQRFALRMAELAGNPARAAEMGRAGHVNVQRFSWGTFVSRIDDEIDSCTCASEKSDPILDPRSKLRGVAN